VSTGKQIDRALMRAAKRDKKRQTGMRVTGKGVFMLAKLIKQPKAR
jgi:hypothetical protein